MQLVVTLIEYGGLTMGTIGLSYDLQVPAYNALSQSEQLRACRPVILVAYTSMLKMRGTTRHNIDLHGMPFDLPISCFKYIPRKK